MIAFCAGQSSIDKGSLSVEADVGEVRLQLVAYSREGQVDRLGVDMEALECCMDMPKRMERS